MGVGLGGGVGCYMGFLLGQPCDFREADMERGR